MEVDVTCHTNFFPNYTMKHEKALARSSTKLNELGFLWSLSLLPNNNCTILCMYYTKSWPARATENPPSQSEC